jgi:branched-chain amino acid transport system ATP-binding protein
VLARFRDFAEGSATAAKHRRRAADLTIGRALMTNPDLLISDDDQQRAPMIARNLAHHRRDSRERHRDADRRQEPRGDRGIADPSDPRPGRVVFEGSSATLLAQPDLLHRHLGV